MEIPKDANGQTPKWLLYGGLGVAAVALFVFMKNQQSGSTGSTVAAGTSINAALGSLQEQVLNTQGAVTTTAAAAAAQSLNQSNNLQTSLDAGFGNLAVATNTLYNQNATTQTAINNVNDNIDAQAASAAHLTTAATGTN